MILQCLLISQCRGAQLCLRNWCRLVSQHRLHETTPVAASSVPCTFLTGITLRPKGQPLQITPPRPRGNPDARGLSVGGGGLLGEGE